MTILSVVRGSLGLTAILNVTVATGFAWPDSAIGILLDLPTLTHPFYAYFSAAMVALFGFVYAWLASLERPRPELLLVGATGKLIAVVITLFLFLGNEVSARMTLLVSGDLVFVVLWLAYLWKRGTMGS